MKGIDPHIWGAGRKKQVAVKRYRLLWHGPNRPRIELQRFRAEQALGKPLPLGAQVHHADGSFRDDAPLVICPNQAYHRELHRKMRIRAAGGNPHTDRLCCRCKRSQPRTEFYAGAGYKTGYSPLCRTCHRIQNKIFHARYMRKWRAARSPIEHP